MLLEEVPVPAPVLPLGFALGFPAMLLLRVAWPPIASPLLPVKLARVLVSAPQLMESLLLGDSAGVLAEGAPYAPPSALLAAGVAGALSRPPLPAAVILRYASPKRRSYCRMSASALACTSVSSAISAARSAGLTPVATLVPSAPTRVASFSLYSMNCFLLASYAQYHKQSSRNFGINATSQMEQQWQQNSQPHATQQGTHCDSPARWAAWRPASPRLPRSG